jgi:hypothetical protein
MLTRLRYRWNRLRHHLGGYSRIHYQAPGAESEIMWAKRLREGLYQIENIPYAEGLNLHDVVRCREEMGSDPVIARVARRSGNRTAGGLR